KVLLTERALADIRDIECFSAKEWGRKTAERYLDDIEAALGRISENPQLLRVEPDLAPALHFYRVRKHLLVCDDLDGSVCVLAVVQAGMDLPSRLAELEPVFVAELRWLHDRLRDERHRP